MKSIFSELVDRIQREINFMQNAWFNIIMLKCNLLNALDIIAILGDLQITIIVK